jgi:hypothetical protein
VRVVVPMTIVLRMCVLLQMWVLVGAV